MLRNAKQTHRNHDIVPSILFVHRFILMKPSERINGWKNEKKQKKAFSHITYTDKQAPNRRKETKNEQPNRTNPNKMLYEFQFGSYTIEGDGASTYLLRLFGATVHTFHSSQSAIFRQLYGVSVPPLYVDRYCEFLCSIYHILRTTRVYSVALFGLRLSFQLRASLQKTNIA